MVYRIIILLFICSALTAQNEVKDDGLTVRYNGLVVRAQADDIVPPSGQPLAGAAGTRTKASRWCRRGLGAEASRSRPCPRCRPPCSDEPW